MRAASSEESEVDSEFYAFDAQHQSAFEEIQRTANKQYQNHPLHKHLIEDVLDKKTLIRFCYARKFDVQNTLELIEKHVNFKQDYKYYDDDDAFLKEKGLEVLNSGFFQWGGFERGGNMIIIFNMQYFYKKIQKDGTPGETAEWETDALIYAWLYIMKKNRKLMERTQRFRVINFFDCSNIELSHLFKKRNEMINFIKKSQSCWPELTKKTLIFNAPLGINTIYNILKVFMDKKAQAKIKFLNGPWDLLNFIDSYDLEQKFGGDHEEYPSFDETQKVSEIVEKRLLRTLA